MSNATLIHQLRALNELQYSVEDLTRLFKCSRYTIKNYFCKNKKMDGVTRLALEKCINILIEKNNELRKNNQETPFGKENVSRGIIATSWRNTPLHSYDGGWGTQPIP